MSHFRIYIPTRTLFGAGMVKELHNQQLPGKKAMIVSSFFSPYRHQTRCG